MIPGKTTVILPGLLHKTCWVGTTLGSPDWTVRVNACTVHIVPARIMQLLEWSLTLSVSLMFRTWPECTEAMSEQ